MNTAIYPYLNRVPLTGINPDNTWREIDMTPFLQHPHCAKGVILEVDNRVQAGVGFRPKGSTDTVPYGWPTIADLYTIRYCKLDADNKIEYRIGSWQMAVNVIGEFVGENVHMFDDWIDVTQVPVGFNGLINTDITAHIDPEDQGNVECAMVCMIGLSGKYWAVEEDGTGGGIWGQMLTNQRSCVLTGISNQDIFDQWNYQAPNPPHPYYLMGYITKDCGNRMDFTHLGWFTGLYTMSITSAWTDVDVTADLPPGSTGAVFVVASTIIDGKPPGTVYIRAKGSTNNIPVVGASYKLGYHCQIPLQWHPDHWGIVQYYTDQILQGGSYGSFVGAGWMKNQEELRKMNRNLNARVNKGIN